MTVHRDGAAAAPAAPSARLPCAHRSLTNHRLPAARAQVPGMRMSEPGMPLGPLTLGSSKIALKSSSPSSLRSLYMSCARTHARGHTNFWRDEGEREGALVRSERRTERRRQRRTHREVIHLGAICHVVVLLEGKELAQVVLDQVLAQRHRALGRYPILAPSVPRGEKGSRVGGAAARIQRFANLQQRRPRARGAAVQQRRRVSEPGGRPARRTDAQD